jgi:hypothetical protein
VRRALLVGIDNYPFGPLGGCVADVEALALLLERHDDGTKNFDVRRLTGPPNSINRPALRAALTELFSQPAEVALFYFSGHGSENDLGGYLVTVDAQAYDEGVPMADVIGLANKSIVSETVIVVDCCHSGHLGNSSPVGPRDANVKAEISEGVSILTASRSTEPAIEVGGRGLFTTLLCFALEGGAADVVGRTKIASIYSYIDESLGSWQQRPLFKSHVTSLLSLRSCDPVIPLDKLRRIVEFFPERESQFSLDPTFERSDVAADAENVAKYDLLAAFRNARLIEVATHDHMYFAAVESGAVRLTQLGRHYWRLVTEDRL